MIYKIKSGDTLGAIARSKGTTVQALMSANPQIKDPNLIYAGASLNIPTTKVTPTRFGDIGQTLVPTPTKALPPLTPPVDTTTPKTLTPPAERTLETPQPKTLPTQEASPLTDFADILSKSTDLARMKRNKMSMELMGRRFDPSAEPASGFAGILSDINRAGREFRDEKIEELIEAQEVKVTKDMQEYQFAQQQGYGDSFAVWQGVGGKETDVISDITTIDKPLTINQVEQFRRSYDWTPPFGFTLSELEQFMADNPTATPEQLEVGAKSFGTTEEQIVTSTATPDEIITSIMSEVSDTQLKALKKKADEAGISSFWKGKRTDVENYLDSIKDKIQIAIDYGYSMEEIISFLTQ